MVPRAPEGALDFPTIFGGRPGPYELDIGFGRGASLFERIEASPSSSILGVEVKTKCVFQVEERRTKLGLDGIRVFADDIRTLLPRIGPEGSLTRAFVHFPDPWWKKRHQHRMVVGDALLIELARLLAPGGDLFIQTDVEDRAHEYVAAVRERSEFVLASESGFIGTNPFAARSNRERRADEDGLPYFRILAHRRGLATRELSGRCGG